VRFCSTRRATSDTAGLDVKGDDRYLVFDMLKQGRAKLERAAGQRARLAHPRLEDVVPIGGASDRRPDPSMVVQSGNDACVVLAEGLAGSEAAFVDKMNQKASEIGLNQSHFADVGGLPNPDHYMTARDLATLALRTIADFPEYYHYYGEKDYSFNNINQGNRNPLIYRDIGADGLKTGHPRSGVQPVGLGASRQAAHHPGAGRSADDEGAAQESERLIEWAFREFSDYQVFAAGDKVDDAELWLGTEAKVPLTVAKDSSSRCAQIAQGYEGNRRLRQAGPGAIRRARRSARWSSLAPDMAQVETPLIAAAGIDRMGPLGRMGWSPLI